MGDSFGRRTGIRRKRNREKKQMCAVFVALVSFFLGSDLITRCTGVTAAQAQHRAL